jgi:hypothetical protein
MKKLMQMMSTPAARRLYAVLLVATLTSLTTAAAAQAWPAGKLSTTYKIVGTFAPCTVTTTYFYWTYTDSSGIKHAFPGTSSVVVEEKGYLDGLYCSGYSISTALDASSGDYNLKALGGSGTVSISATIFPKYQILSLIYDAPGNQSNNGFTDTTFYGTINSIGSSFSAGVTLTFTATGGIFGLGSGLSSSVGFTQGYGTTNSFTNTITSGQGLALDSTQNPINHTNDTFWIWLNPEVAVTQTGSTAATYTVSPPSGQIMYAVRVSVAQLQTPSTIPAAILDPVVINGVTYPGLSNICKNPAACVSSDFTQILATDPIISITSDTPPSQIDSKRYFQLNPEPSPLPYLEHGTTDTITLTDQNQSDETQTETTQYQTTFSTIWGGTSSATPVDWTLQFMITDTFTWTQMVSLDNFSGTSHQMSLVLGTSTSGCDEPIDVYEDYNYHTFVAVPASTPPAPCDSN